jgi:hypothetical protein
MGIIKFLKLWESIPIEYNDDHNSFFQYQKVINGKCYKWQRSEIAAFKEFCRDEIKEICEWLDT